MSHTRSAASEPVKVGQVKVGQVWADCNPRCPARRLRIWAVGDVVAKCENVASGRVTFIRLDRFRPGRTGYRLEREARA